jgi:hypothetical protein
MLGRRPWAVALAVGVVGVAGCAPVTPSPSAGSGSPSPSPAQTAAPATTDPTPTLTPTPTLGLPAEMEFGRLDPEFTDTVHEFASDGESILFSSGFADDAGADASPDLWRLRVYAPEPEPEPMWRNPERDHAIVKIAGDLGMVGFVDIPLDGSRAWNLWLIPRHEEEAILLDTHPGDEDVPSLVPSVNVQEQTIAWTAFDRGPDGPVSQLLWAHAPDWQPKLLLERRAEEAELWFPDLNGSSVVFCELTYSADRTTDDRAVHHLDIGSEADPVRLDHSDLATMPIFAGDSVIWKEADPGFSMFNWGRLWRSEIGGPGPSALDTGEVEYVNYPSAGSRFITWWSSDAFQFVVFDLLENRPRVIEQYTGASGANVLRPHIAWDLLVWLYVEGETSDGFAELRYAIMPPLRAP